MQKRRPWDGAKPFPIQGANRGPHWHIPRVFTRGSRKFCRKALQGLFEKTQTPSFCPTRADFCVGKPRKATAFLAVSALKPLHFDSKIRHLLYFQTSPEPLNPRPRLSCSPGGEALFCCHKAENAKETWKKPGFSAGRPLHCGKEHGIIAKLFETKFQTSLLRDNTS